MTLALDPSASKVFLSKGLADPKLKKEAVKLADRVGSLFLLHISSAYHSSSILSRASELCEEKKKKTIEAEDVIKALSTSGFDSYVDVFKKALEESKAISRSL